MTSVRRDDVRLEPASAAEARAWLALAGVLLAAIALQPLFAGLMVRDHDWARTAHDKVAFGLEAAAMVSMVVAGATLRRRAGGRALVSALAALAALLIVQTVLGERAADGRDLLWLHFPLGVALFGAAMRLLRAARLLTTPS